MWWTPFLTGFGVALLLGLGSTGLHLRGSVWQALSVSQWSAVGGVIASIFSWPVLPVAAIVAGLSLIVVQLRRDAEHLPLGLFLLGSAVVLVLAGNFGQAELSAANWAEGQLYFVTKDLGWVTLSVIALTGFGLRLLVAQWLRLQAAPDQGLYGQPSGWHLALEALWWTTIIVLASVTFGLIATLALLLFPAWTAGSIASNANQFLAWSIFIAGGGYLLAWTCALAFDQPFSPVLVIVLALIQFSSSKWSG